ncbi:MAG: cobalt ECF transporter T component CbiQ [Ruthenibacterium lactatiformans]
MTVNPGLKLWCCAALLALCLLARTPWPPLALFFAASALTAAGGVRPRAYLSLLGAPAAFLLLSGIALLWEYASAPGGVANVPFLGGYFVLRAPAQTAARLVMARALGAVGCLYFLSLSTPVPELLDALRRARVPEVVGDLAVLIYRYIFILFATFRSMRDAAASRLGYAGPVRSLRTTGRVYGGCWRTASGGRRRALTRWRAAAMTAASVFDAGSCARAARACVRRIDGGHGAGACVRRMTRRFCKRVGRRENGRDPSV